MLAMEFCSVMVGYDRGTGMVIRACSHMELIVVVPFIPGYRIRLLVSLCSMPWWDAILLSVL